MVILRTRNKITDFFMILAWASPFNQNVFYLIKIDYNVFYLIRINQNDCVLPDQN